MTYGSGVPSGHSRLTGAVLQPGQPFGPRYRILRELGSGGMGVVYQAWDAELGVAVALKIIRPDVTADPSLAQDIERRFKRELLLARQVTHKNVVRIHDLGEVDGVKYITMPYIEGRDLASVLRERGQLPVQEALRIARQVASGLLAAHEAGVVHRDLKPENVMIDQDGQALIMDFGISRSVSAATATGTTAGAIVGTLEYMAPEQARGLPVDHRADLYSFGLMLHDLIAGRRRLQSTESALSEMMRRMQQSPPPLRTVVPEAPADVEAIVGKCLLPDPGARYATTAELLAAFEGLDADGRVLRKHTVEHRWQAATATMLVLVLLSAGAAVWFARHNSAPAPAPIARQPVSILIADFVNETREPVFESSLEQALGIAMEGAPFVTSFPRLEAQRAIQRQQKDGRLDEGGTRLVAASQGIGVILLGSIAKAAGEAYDLSVRAVDPRADKVVASQKVRAANKAQVLQAVGELASGIRRELGDSPPADAVRDYSETFTAGSLGAMREYSIAQQLALNRRDDEAIPHYRKSIESDPKFGRAYAGWAVSAYTIGRRAEAKEKWDTAMSLIGGMTERERYRTIGSYHLGVSRNYPQAIQQFRELVSKYPADTAGQSNLALAHFFMLEFPPAFEAGRKAMELQPGSYRFASNFALYAMYAGQFEAAAGQSSELIAKNPERDVAYLPLAIAQLDAGKTDEARRTYSRMASLPSGASLAAMGLADAAMWQGRYADVATLLEPALAADIKSANTAGIASKYLALAEARAALGDRSAALEALKKAVATGEQEDVLYPAAHVYMEIGRDADARALAARLLAADPVRARAYGKLAEGERALRAGKARDAVDLFAEARKLSNVWLTHLGLGIAYVQAGRFPEALTELDQAHRRRGEASALFLDDIPTYRALSPLDYWRARAHDGVGSKPAARELYEKYLARRASAPGDALAADARRRLQPGS